jgi:CelD/BcsL family acetyltransferase involved in cellulose biosynthesis
MSVDFDEVNDVAHLDRYGRVWEQAFGATPSANFFQSLDWLRLSWPQFPRWQRLRALVSSSGDPWVVPFCVREERFKVGPLRLLTFPLNDWSGEFTPLGSAPATALTRGLEHAFATPRDWDLIDLRWTDEDFLPAAVEAFTAVGVDPQVEVRMERPVVVFTPGEAYEDRLSTKLRQNLRRSRKQLEAMGRLTIEHFRPLAGDDPRVDLFEACSRVGKESWQHHEKAGFTSDPVRELMHGIHHAAAALGQLTLTAIRLDAIPIAFVYGFHVQGRTIAFRNGYDAQYVKTGVGALALHEWLLHCEASGDRIIDLGPGTYEYKARAATALQKTYSVMHYSRYGVRSQLMRAWRSIEPAVRGRTACEKRRLVQ